MRHLQHNHPNQIFGSASSDDISLPATTEWQRGLSHPEKWRTYQRKEGFFLFGFASLSQRSCLQGWTPISSVQTVPVPSAWRDSCGGMGRDNLIYSSGSGMNSCAAKETPSCVLWKSSLSDTGWQLSESLGRDLILQSINSSSLFHNWENWGSGFRVFHGRFRTRTLGSSCLTQRPLP